MPNPSSASIGEAKTAVNRSGKSAGLKSVASSLVVFGLLVIAVSVEALGHLFRSAYPNQAALSECISLLAILTVLSPAQYLLIKIDGAVLLKRTMMCATIILALAQVLNITGNIRALDGLPIVSGNGQFRDAARWGSLVLGLVLMLASLYFALLETVRAKGKLLEEHKELVVEVAERKRAEVALVEQENVYRHAIAQAGAIPYRVHWPTKHYTFYEDEIYKFSGFSPEELTFDKIRSMPVETRFLGDLAGLSQDEVDRRMANGEVHYWQSEYKIYSKQGEEKWVSDNSVEIFGDDGKVVETVGLLQDISQRKREEETLARSERYFRALIENALDLITILDADGAVRYLSPSVQRVLGYSPEELNGKNVFDYVHPDDRERVMRTLLHSIENPNAMPTSQFRCLHKDGSWSTLESYGRSLLDDPAIHGVVINSRDITERVALEHQLLQSQKMEGIGRLAGGVAHDFNNLLTCISGYGELAQLRTQENDRLRTYIDQMLEGARQASDLTRQLLAFARKQIVEPRNTDLNTLTLKLDRMLRRLIGEDIDLITMPSAQPAIVRIDPGHFEQVVLNLVVNARDAMPNGGRLTIEIDVMQLDEEYAKVQAGVEPGSYVVFAVSDTGIGMSEAVRSRIFEPFFTTKEANQGTGLGLATCYGIVKQAGGHIWVYSEIGQGTTFKIYLPEAAGKAVMAPARESSFQMFRGSGTVLLVEDDPLVRAITFETLTEAGYTVIVANDGASALESSRKHDGVIHLLLTDVVLPQMSGRQLAEQLAVERRDTKVLFMSGYTEDAIIHHGVLEQGISFLPKPFTPGVLARKVRSVLECA